MPWRERRTMNLKLEFVERAKAPDRNMAALCREYGITRETGYKWLARFEAEGYDGLDERSRGPESTPLSSAEEIVMSVVEARRKHPRWGPRKLVALLRRTLGERTPSERTVARLVKRFGLLRERRRKRPLNVVEHAPQVVVKAPNDVWTIDFKGWWRAANGERCDPLTVRDAFSRYVLDMRLLASTGATAVRAVFERLFRKHGLPIAIQCDNGTPFVATNSRGGLTTLSAWWVSLGIRIVRSRPGCPQDNGGHERMHRDVSADVQAAPSSCREVQQRDCDRWRKEFNSVRPHESLKNQVPADLYKASPLRPRARIATYPEDWLTLRVSNRGEVTYHQERYFVSAALRGCRIGLKPLGDLRYQAWYFDIDLGELELATEAELESISRRRSDTTNRAADSGAILDAEPRAKTPVARRPRSTEKDV